MKKRRVLKKWVKVVLTIMLVVVCVLVFKHAGVTGALAQTDKSYIGVCVAEWVYLFILQFMLLDSIWSN